MANYGMAFDYHLCINCHSCEVACKEENGVGLGAKSHRLWIEEEFDEDRDFFNLSQVTFMQQQCQQCLDAPCMKICPNKAIYRDDNGIVRLHKQKCDLTLSCMNACPYHARHVDTKNHITDKCIFCADTRLLRGEITTACQITCPTKVRIFGDLDDKNSEISRVLRNREYKQLKTELNTKPKLFYLLPKE